MKKIKFFIMMSGLGPNATNLATTAAMTATGSQAVTVTNNFLTVINGVTTQATGNRTLDLTIDDSLVDGAMLHVKHKTAGTETLTYGTGIDAPVITGVAGKTMCQAFIFNRVAGVFLPTGAHVQID